MGRACALSFFLGIAGCGAELQILRLDLGDGYQLLLRTRRLEANHVRVAGTLLRDGLILDEPEVVVETGGRADLVLNLDAPQAVGAAGGSGCPLSSDFLRFEPSARVRIRVTP